MQEFRARLSAQSFVGGVLVAACLPMVLQQVAAQPPYPLLFAVTVLEKQEKVVMTAIKRMVMAVVLLVR